MPLSVWELQLYEALSIPLRAFGQLLMSTVAPPVVLLCRPMHFRLLHAALWRAGSGFKVNVSAVTKSGVPALPISLSVLSRSSHKITFTTFFLPLLRAIISFALFALVHF